MAKDNTVTFNYLSLQIPPGSLRPHFVHARVKVRQYHNGGHAIFHGQRCLDLSDNAGVLQEDADKVA